MGSPNGVSDKFLDCLNSWPEGTRGYVQEQELISILNSLCKNHGYGRVPQLAASIEEIWRNPEVKIIEYEKIQDEHMKFMKSCEENNV